MTQTTRRILIIEDTPSQRDAAKAIIEEAGYEAIVMDRVTGQQLAKLLGEVDGVITDLHFNPFAKGCHHAGYNQNPPPAGLMVVLAAMYRQVPVVVCTDCQGEGHHGYAVGWLWDGFVSPVNEECWRNELDYRARQTEFEAQWEAKQDFSWSNVEDVKTRRKDFETRMASLYPFSFVDSKD